MSATKTKLYGSLDQNSRLHENRKNYRIQKQQS